MDAYTNVILDYENGTEIIFSMPPGGEISYPNEVVDFIRSAKNRTESWISSAGMREIKFQMQTYSSPTLERQLDYFRRIGKSLLLFIPNIYFASEIVIHDVNLTEKCETTQTFDVSAYCYGIEGVSALATASIMYGEPASVPDADSIGGLVSPLYEIYHDIQGFESSTSNIYMPAGSWSIIVRAKSTVGTANDLFIRGHDPTAAEYFVNGTKTVGTSGYQYYIANGTVDSNNVPDHLVQVYASKATTATNTIYVDLIAYVHASGLITV